MYGVIAKVLGSATPEPDLSDFITAIQRFEKNHMEERDVLSALRLIHSVDNTLISGMRTLHVGLPAELWDAPESLVRKIEPALQQLQNRGLLTWSFGVRGLGFAEPGQPGGGNFGNISLTISPPLAAFLRRAEFNS